MRKIGFLLLLSSLSVNAFSACPAGLSDGRNFVKNDGFQLNYVTAEEDGYIEFQVEQNDRIFNLQFDGSNEVGKNSLSIILTAAAAKKDFSFHMGACLSQHAGKYLAKNIRIDI